MNATDKADNFSSAERKFSVLTNVDAIQKNIGHYFHDLKLISDQEEFDYYQARIAHTKSLLDQLAGARKNKKPPANPRDKNIAIKVENISKTFRISHEKISNLSGALVNDFLVMHT